MRYNRGTDGHTHVARLMGSFLQIFIFERTKKNNGRQKQNKMDTRSERNKYGISWKPRQTGNIFLYNGWSACFVFKEQVTIVWLAVTQYQTVCQNVRDALCHTDQIADCIDVWTELPNGCALNSCITIQQWNYCVVFLRICLILEDLSSRRNDLWSTSWITQKGHVRCTFRDIFYVVSLFLLFSSELWHLGAQVVWRNVSEGHTASIFKWPQYKYPQQ